MTGHQAIVSTTNLAKISFVRNSATVSYPHAVQIMETHVRSMQQQITGERVWLLEHPALYTAGTSAREDDVTNPYGLPVFHTGRGGQWTYHGPGQRVCYIMLDLNHPHGEIPARDIRAFVKGLERWLIASLNELGVKCWTSEGRIGVWTHDPATKREAKIAALGIRVSRWVTWHGVSINLAPQLSHFSGIVACGLRDYSATSLERFNPTITMDDLDRVLLAQWHNIFGSVPRMVRKNLLPTDAR